MRISRCFRGRVGNWPRNMALFVVQHWTVERLVAPRAGSRDGVAVGYNSKQPHKMR